MCLQDGGRTAKTRREVNRIQMSDKCQTWRNLRRFTTPNFGLYVIGSSGRVQMCSYSAASGKTRLERSRLVILSTPTRDRMSASAPTSLLCRTFVPVTQM